MKLYVMRHGTTRLNETGVIQGRCHNRLSKKGIEEVEDKAKEFRDVDIDAIICSPLARAVQTANIINKYHNARIIKDEQIIEIDQGIFTGRKKRGLSLEEKKLKETRAKSAMMESYEDCYNRVREFIKTMKQKYEYKSVLIVTHNCVATFIQDVVNHETKDFTNDKFMHDFKNAEIKSFMF